MRGSGERLATKPDRAGGAVCGEDVRHLFGRHVVLVARVEAEHLRGILNCQSAQVAVRIEGAVETLDQQSGTAVAIVHQLRAGLRSWVAAVSTVSN